MPAAPGVLKAMADAELRPELHDATLCDLSPREREVIQLLAVQAWPYSFAAWPIEGKILLQNARNSSGGYTN